MRYRDLHDLIQNSYSSRAYFLSLPVQMQCALHQLGGTVHSAAQLHRQVSAIQQTDHLLQIGHWK